MTDRFGIGKGGMVLVLAVAFAMTLLAFIFKPVSIAPVPYGVCLPSPDEWEIASFLSWIINTLLIGLIATLLYLINKSYNFIRSTEPVLPALFLLFTCSNAWCTQSLNTSTLLCIFNVLGIGIIFSTYDCRNATQQLFTIGAVLGVGSMIQYAFFPMVIVVLVWTGIMKIFRLKEILAFFGGIFCPYWIAFGFGWIDFSDLRFPSLVSLFTDSRDHADILFLISEVAIAAAVGFILCIINSVKLYAGNSKINAMNMCITVSGLISLLCMVIDYENMPAYIMTLFMTVAVQFANICALWNVRHQWLVTTVPGIIYVLLFSGTLFF